MSYIKTSHSGEPVKIFYQDWGKGKPVVFIHGWPSSHEMWEYQLTELPHHGLRCIAYDRRGFGKSDKPWEGYDYDTLAGDLKALLDELDLEDVTLVGFSMGGGEVVRYMSRYQGARISRIVLVSAVTPYLLQTEDNPEGVEKTVFDDIIQQIREDRPEFLSNFGKQFFGVNLVHKPLSHSMLEWASMLCLVGSPKATLDCVHSFSETDFRDEMLQINVPALVIHGDNDKIVPLEPTGQQSAKLIKNAVYRVYEGAPHGLYYTDKDKLNADLLSFIGTKMTTTFLMSGSKNLTM